MEILEKVFSKSTKESLKEKIFSQSFIAKKNIYEKNMRFFPRKKKKRFSEIEEKVFFSFFTLHNEDIHSIQFMTTFFLKKNIFIIIIVVYHAIEFFFLGKLILQPKRVKKNCNFELNRSMSISLSTPILEERLKTKTASPEQHIIFCLKKFSSFFYLTFFYSHIMNIISVRFSEKKY